jgi:hypothetical protein
MKRAFLCLTACSLLALYACGGEEGPTDEQVPPWEVEEVSQPADEPGADVGEVEQAASVLVWQIASSRAYYQCSCGSLPSPWGYLYQPCGPNGATKRTCWRYSGYCFVYDLKCSPYYY